MVRATARAPGCPVDVRGERLRRVCRPGPHAADGRHPLASGGGGSSTFRRTFGSCNRQGVGLDRVPNRDPLGTATPTPPAVGAAPTSRRDPRRPTVLPPPGGSAG